MIPLIILVTGPCTIGMLWMTAGISVPKGGMWPQTASGPPWSVIWADLVSPEDHQRHHCNGKALIPALRTPAGFPPGLEDGALSEVPIQNLARQTASGLQR